MYVVKFNSVDEFIAEVIKEKAHIDRGVVRTTIQTASTEEFPSCRRVSVLASAVSNDPARADSMLIKLERSCGVMVFPEEVMKINKVASDCLALIENSVTEHGLMVRPGNIEGTV